METELVAASAALTAAEAAFTEANGRLEEVEVERRTLEERREELGREAFLEKVWAWKEKYHGNIRRQLDLLGASCDWTRERFTLDEQLSVAVRHAFVELYRRGLIRRDEYMVNWSPDLDTAVSDLEVEIRHDKASAAHARPEVFERIAHTV